MEAADSQAESTQDKSSDSAYVFHELIRNVPLSADGEEHDCYITCAEFWGMLTAQHPCQGTC